MSTLFKIILFFICFICLWNISTLTDMIVVTNNTTNINDTFLITGIVIPSLVLVTLGILVLLFSLVGVVLVTLFIVTLTLAIVGISFSWPLLIAGLVLYWLFKQPNKQKI